MTSLVRRRLWISHLAVLGMGVIVGMLAWPARESAAEPAALSAKSDGASAGGRSAGGSKATTFPASHYAAAWETLKDGRLPRQERLEIQRSLLREWSVLDLEAAFRAVFAEGPGSQADLLEACDSGILADPSAAWALAMTRAVGWESARVRTRWLEIVADKDPLRVFPVLDQVSPSERTDAVEDLARA